MPPSLDGDCVNLEPDYECLCYAGFQFRGGACIDVDECADYATSNPCGLEGMCRNNRGGYVCECGEGYEYREGTCLDIGENNYALCTDRLKNGL